MSRQIRSTEQTRLITAGNSGAAARRFKARLIKEGWTTTEDFKLKPGFLYTVVRAISARVNQNYDGWPSDELKKSYKTFLHKPVFVNHENHDPSKARGVVVAARYVENGMDKYIEVVQEIDAGRFPKLAHEIKTGGLDSVSMGAEAGFTICSYCHNKATDLHDMCDHVRNHKGKTLRRFDKRTGSKEDVLVFESCHKISFFELSYVFEPADETAVASKVVVAGKHRHASDYEYDPDDCGHNDEELLADGQSIKCHECGTIWTGQEGWNPDDEQDPFDPRLIGAGLRTATDDLAVPAIPGTPTINQSVIDSTPVIELNPATELTGHEAPGLGKQSAFAADLADIMKLAGECPPGMDCSRNMGLANGMEQITKDSPNNPVNQVSYTPGTIGQPGSGGGGGTPDGSGILPNARPLYDELMKEFPGSDIGGYRVDNYHEHDSGALDFMTTDEAQAAKVREKAFAQGAPYVLWKQQQWNADGSTSAMEDRGSPTQNHFDHVHIAPIPAKAVATPAAQQVQPTGTQPTQRAAGKYTKEDFAAAGGKKPWETEAPATKRAPVEEDDLREIEAMMRRMAAPLTNPAKPPRPIADQVKAARARRKVRSAVLRKVARNRAIKLAWGEQEAPMAVDTLREEGSAPEDDNNDFERYVDPPKDLQTPDLSQAAQIDRQQELQGAGPEQMGGVPGAAEGGPAQDQGQYITLKIPMPNSAPQVPQQAAPPVAAPPAMPPAADPTQQQPPAAPPQQIAASLLDYFDNYYGRRIANWLDAIEANRGFTPEESADYRRQAAQLSTLQNGRGLSTTGRNPQKGTANMARHNIASRTKVATAGRRQHFAEGPLVDGGDRSRNDQGEQEEAFISQTPPFVEVDFPDDDTPNISNTEHNLVARVQQGRAQLMRDAQQLASLRQRRAFDEAGGPTAEIVDPTVNTGREGEKLTGDDFISADPNDGVVPTNPKDASLRAFQAFDGWLAQKTGKSSRRHREATIKKAAAQFSREAGISPQALFPALGIVLREARKNDKKANTKGAAMRKRADEKLEVAAPDGRIDVESPVENVTSAEAQASQFDLHDFGDNAGDNIANPDLSTDQNWAPGEASGKKASIKTAGGLLAMRCAEGMIAAGLEPNSRERKYQLAAEFEQMNRGLIQDRVALLERFAAVRQADLRKVASGSSRGAARSPIPAGLGGGTRTAAAPQRLAAHDPRNDSSLFI